MIKKEIQITEEERNNPYYMKNLITRDKAYFYEIGDELSKNPTFMLLALNIIMKMHSTPASYIEDINLVYDYLDDSLRKDTNFIIRFVNTVMANNTLEDEDILFAHLIADTIDMPFLLGNEEFWKVMEERGFKNPVYDHFRTIDEFTLSSTQEERIKSILSNSNKINEKNYFQYISQADRKNAEFMLRLICEDEVFYDYADPELKEDKLFHRIARQLNSNVPKLHQPNKIKSDKDKTQAQRRENAIKNVDKINLFNYEDYLNDFDRQDVDFMLSLIRKNPQIYLIADVSQVATFRARALEVNPKVKVYVDEEIRKREETKEARKAVRQAEKDQVEAEEEARLKKEYEIQGESHPNLILVNSFLESKMSRKAFCQKNNIDIERLNDAIQEVSIVFPDMQASVSQKGKKSRAVYVNKRTILLKSILSGEMTITQYSREHYSGIKISELFKFIDSRNDNEFIRKQVLKAIAFGELRMMDYIRLFNSKENPDFDSTIDSVRKFIIATEKFFPELKGKDNILSIACKRTSLLNKYRRQYKKSEFLGSKRGFLNPDTGKIEMTVITQEHLDYARKYLLLQDEYVCATTMGEALNKLIKGEITKEEIDKRSQDCSLEQRKKLKEQKSAEYSDIVAQIEEQSDKEKRIKGTLGIQLEGSLSLDENQK